MVSSGSKQDEGADAIFCERTMVENSGQTRILDPVHDRGGSRWHPWLQIQFSVCSRDMYSTV